MNLEFREYRKEDFKDLQQIIRETWHYDELTTPKIAEKLAKVFLSSCLTNYTYSRVALFDNKAVGIILVNYKEQHKCKFSYRLKQIMSILSLFMHKEGRKVFKIFGSISGIDKVLLEEANLNYDGELALFAVDSKMRGKGVGKELFNSALSYMDEVKMNDFYLFTDTSCNFGFYEHQGMKRRVEKDHTFNIDGQESKMHFYIYDYELN